VKNADPVLVPPKVMENQGGGEGEQWRRRQDREKKKGENEKRGHASQTIPSVSGPGAKSNEKKKIKKGDPGEKEPGGKKKKKKTGGVSNAGKRQSLFQKLRRLPEEGETNNSSRDNRAPHRCQGFKRGESTRSTKKKRRDEIAGATSHKQSK